MARRGDKDWCERCYARKIRHIAKMSGRDKNVFVDTEHMTFMCKHPRFSQDSNGNPVVVMYDCEAGIEKVMGLSEWRKGTP